MSAPSQHDKATRFQALHRSGTFVMPNPFDGGSARTLEKLGFVALATSSGASAGTLGKRDGGLTREQVLAHVRMVAESTTLPVSADLENGFGVEPEHIAETIRLTAAQGLRRGLRRISFGSSLYEVAMKAVTRAAAPTLKDGRFAWLDDP